MNSIFELVVKTSMYGTIAGAIILIIKGVLKENLTHKWYYLLWLILVIKLVFPFGPQSDFSIFNKVENSKIGINTINTYGNNKHLAIKSKDIEKIEDTNLSSSLEPEYIQDMNFSYDISDKEINLYAYISISNLWILVSTIIFSFVIITYIKLNISLYRNKYNDCNNRLYYVLKECKQVLNIKRKIIITKSEYINTPAITGVLVPKIIIPLEMRDLSEIELKYIFLHELSHYKRKDNIVSLFLLIIQSIHWFNPFIFYYFKMLRNDMELATDEKVLSTLRLEEYNEYGFTLLNIISKINKCKSQPNIIGMAKNKKSLERRIMNIKNLKHPKRKKSSLTTIGSLVLITASILILTNAQTPNLAFANISEGENSSYQLNKMQNSFFKIVEYTEDNKNILLEDMRKFNKNLNLEKTEQLGKKDMADIYTINNEEIKVYYEKRDGQGPYYVRNVEYNMKNKDENITLIRLSHMSIFKDEKTIELQIGTESLEELDKDTKLLNFNARSSETFKLYLSLLKEIEINENFNTKDLTNFNSNFIDTGDNVLIMSSDNYEIKVGFNNENGESSYVTFYDYSNDNFNRQYINTKTKHLEYKEWDIQEHYENEYSFEKSSTGHIITVNNDDVDEAKENFIEFMNKFI